MDHDETVTRLLNRRATLRLFGGAGAVALWWWKDGLPVTAWTPPVNGPAAGESTMTCLAKPEQTEGPYFVDERLNRSDIRSDAKDGSVKQGVPLRLSFAVHRVTDICVPLSGAYVDVWHCDAEGVYSDFGEEGTAGKTHLRGYQVTDDNGAAQFLTIYPGWYRGRTVHIHFKIRVFIGARQVYDFTSQLYFDDAISDRVLAEAPYNSRGARDATNRRDGIFNSTWTDGKVRSKSGASLMLALDKDAKGYTGAFGIGLVGVPEKP